MNSEITAQLERYITHELLKQPGRRITPDEAIITSGILSSLHLVDVALFVEDAFGVRIDDTELASECFDTLRQLVAIIEARRSTP